MENDKVFKTKCGMHIKNETFVVTLDIDLYYGDKHYPYNYCGHMRKCADCRKYIVKAGDIVLCELVESDEPYDHDNSVNKVVAEYQKQYRKEYLAITGGKVCYNITQDYDRAKKIYQLTNCIGANCRNEICYVTGKKRTKKDLEPVNIFYDTKSVQIEGFIRFETWQLENKYFKTRIARDLAEKYMGVIGERGWIREHRKMYNVKIQARRTPGLEEKIEKVIVREAV